MYIIHVLILVVIDRFVIKLQFSDTGVSGEITSKLLFGLQALCGWVYILAQDRRSYIAISILPILVSE